MPKRPLLLWLSGMLVAIAATVFLFLYTTPGASGSFESASDVVGTWRWEPSSCSSGGRRHFEGVSLWHDNESRIRVLADAGPGPGISVWAGDGGAETYLTLTRERCRALGVSMTRARTRGGSGIWDGTVDVDCDLPDGGWLRGQASFRHCS